VINLVILSIVFAFYLEIKEKRSLKSQEKQHLKEARSEVFKKDSWWPLREMTGIQWNLIIGFLLFFGALILYIHTRQFPDEPSLFPSILLIFIMILSGWLVIESLFFPSKRGGVKILEGWPFLKISLVILLVLIYITSASYLGFYFSTFLFMFLLPFVLTTQRSLRFLLENIIVALGFSVLLFFTFNKFLMVPTPSGLLF